MLSSLATSAAPHPKARDPAQNELVPNYRRLNVWCRALVGYVVGLTAGSGMESVCARLNASSFQSEVSATVVYFCDVQ
jgi:hypothetical protein